jgi:hypothetical protein
MAAARRLRDGGLWVMKPLDTNQAIWLARGEALGMLLRLLQRWLRAGAARLRTSDLGHRLRTLGPARRRLG